MKGSDRGQTGAGSGPGGRAGKGAGYMDPEVVGCQFSVYPLRQDDIGVSIRAAIEAVHSEGCSVRVGNLSTLLTGSEDRVFRALRAAFRAAQRHGSAVMTVTLAAGMPTDELVGEIQRDVAPHGEAPKGAGSAGTGSEGALLAGPAAPRGPARP